MLFPLVTCLLVVATFICHIIDRNYRLPSQYINFSGDSITSRKYYVLFTFGLFHGNLSHLIQQLTLLIPLSIALEFKIGSTLLFISYFLCGILGTAITWRIDRIYYANLYPGTGQFLADSIWSRGASGHVYGIAGLSAILCSKQYLFQHYPQYIKLGSFWMLITNFLFHLFSSKSYFMHYPIKSYSILILTCLIMINLIPLQITINQYLCSYFIHLGIWRLYPQTFNVKVDSFVASDFKSHLIGSLFGALFGVMLLLINDGWSNSGVSYDGWMPLVCILISDGICGQYMVHRRIQFNLAQMRRRENKISQQKK